MFPVSYFPDSYFAPRYWPKIGATGIVFVPPICATISISRVTGSVDITKSVTGSTDIGLNTTGSAEIERC